MEMIRTGRADVVVHRRSKPQFTGFLSLDCDGRPLSTRNDSLKGISALMTVTTDGFVLGEGGG
jgi:3-oxoacyl-(acyl-carrier-protein) synthase